MRTHQSVCFIIIHTFMLSCLLMGSSALAEDQIVTKRGVIRGRVLSADKSSITIEIPGRGKMTYPRSIVERVKVEPPPSVVNGIKAYENGNMREAKLNLGKVMLQYQGLDVEWARKGMVYFGRASLYGKDYKKAEHAFNAFLDAYPDHPLIIDAMIGLAEVEQSKKNCEKALEIFRKLAEPYDKQLKPGKAQLPYAAEIYMGIGKCMEEQNDTDGALKSYIRIIALYPAEKFYPEALYRTARIFTGMNQWDKAGRYLSELINRYPSTEFAKKGIKEKKVIEKKKAAEKKKNEQPEQ